MSVFYFSLVYGAECNHGHEIEYIFDWGDGNSSGWLGPYKSGEKVSAYHKWDEKGTFEIRAKAKDITGAKSEWSETLVVTNSKEKYVNNNLILEILQNYSLINYILDLVQKLC